VAVAVRHNTTVNSTLILTDMLKAEAFFAILVASFPLDMSVATLHCGGDMDDDTTFFSIHKKIGLQNNSLKHVIFDVQHGEEWVRSQLGKNKEQEFILAVRQKYSIEDLCIDEIDEPIGTICRLNKAARSCLRCEFKKKVHLKYWTRSRIILIVCIIMYGKIQFTLLSTAPIATERRAENASRAAENTKDGGDRAKNSAGRAMLMCSKLKYSKTGYLFFRSGVLSQGSSCFIRCHLASTRRTLPRGEKAVDASIVDALTTS